jgi:hypothetical protein
MAPRVTRRAALGGGAALLGSLLALERAVIAAYDASATVLRGDALRLSRAIRRREEEHVRRLEQTIRDLGGEPPAGRTASEYERQFPRLTTQSDALRFLEDLEERQVRGYLEALSELPELEPRTMAAELGADEGEQLAVVRVLGGGSASPHPFETGAL